jgi:hypothetical protein
MKYIGFKHQRENKQNSDNLKYYNLMVTHTHTHMSEKLTQHC